jgi:uncharacterized membrane protein YkvA (DUF1232 family)
MGTTSFKVTFNLDEQDASYFRGLFRKARKLAKDADQAEVLAAARTIVESVRRTKRTPKFVLEAVETLEDLVQIIDDKDWNPPKAVSNQVLGALTYFSNPDDLIPDDIPVLGFLDDAIMIKIVEAEFKYELAAFRKFRKFRRGAEQRPWTEVASKRLPGRLDAQRKKLRADVDKRRKAAERKGIASF